MNTINTFAKLASFSTETILGKEGNFGNSNSAGNETLLFSILKSIKGVSVSVLGYPRTVIKK